MRQPPHTAHVSRGSVLVPIKDMEALPRINKSRMMLAVIGIGFFAIVVVLFFTRVSLSRPAILAVGIAQLLFIPGFLLTLVCSPMRVRATSRGDDESDSTLDIVERITISVAFSIILSSGIVFVLARARRVFMVAIEVTPMDFIGLAIALNLFLITLALVRAYGARWLPWTIGVLGVTATLSVPLVGGVRAAQFWAWPIIGVAGIAMIGAIVVTRFGLERR